MPNDIPIKNPRSNKILVTGGRGFLGRHLAIALKELSFDMRIYEGDVRKIDRFKGRYGTVCHLAAINKIGDDVTEKKLFDVNVGGTSAVMHYCSKNGSRCIFASSAAVYKSSRRDGLLSETSSTGPVTLYGTSKMLAENICIEQAKKKGLSLAILRFFNIYGPGQSNDFLVPYIISRLSENKPVILKTPYAVRDFIHVLDAARALAAVCVKRENGLSLFNIGTGKGISVREIAALVGGIMNTEPRIAEGKGCIRKKDFIVADIGLIRKYVGWTAGIKLRAGLREVVQRTVRI